MLFYIRVFFLQAFLLSTFVLARDLSETFDTAGLVDSTNSTAVWNIVRGTVHLPYIVDRTKGASGANGGGTPEDDEVDIGDGRDGAFTSDRFSQFDTAGGRDLNNITLDTSRIYRFTTFTLPSGVRLKASGTSPLRIYVLGDMEIAGTIDINGADGGAPSGAPGVGGKANCGGAKGGNGGDIDGTGDADDGGHADNGNVGGGIKAVGESGVGVQAKGGGGGGYSGNGSTGVGGTIGGNTYGDEFISTLIGGSGGGGGGGQTANDVYGAGGGAGGGAITIHVGGNLTIKSTGAIEASGGDAGDAPGLGGDGGGGAGGAIQLFAGGEIYNAGQLLALGGTGVGGGTGALTGEGSGGRIRYCTTSGDITPQGAGFDNPPPLTSPFGQTFYSLNTRFVTSKVRDTLNSAPTYLSVTTDSDVPAGAALLVELSSSSDGFVSDDSGWVNAASDLSALSGKRYYRFRVSLTAASRASVPVVRALTVSITDRTETAFQFRVAGCAATQPGAPSSQGASIAALIFWFAFIEGVRRWGRFAMRFKS